MDLRDPVRIAHAVAPANLAQSLAMLVAGDNDHLLLFWKLLDALADGFDALSLNHAFFGCGTRVGHLHMPVFDSRVRRVAVRLAPGRVDDCTAHFETRPCLERRPSARVKALRCTYQSEIPGLHHVLYVEARWTHPVDAFRDGLNDVHVVFDQPVALRYRASFRFGELQQLPQIRMPFGWSSPAQQ